MNWLEHYSNAANALNKGDVTKAHSEYALGLKASQTLTGTDRQVAVDTLNSFRKLLDAATAKQSKAASNASGTSAPKDNERTSGASSSSSTSSVNTIEPPKRTESPLESFVAMAFGVLFFGTIIVFALCHDPLQPWVVAQAQQSVDNKDFVAADRWLWLAGDTFHTKTDKNAARLIRVELLLGQGKIQEAENILDKAKEDPFLKAQVDFLQQRIKEARGLTPIGEGWDLSNPGNTPAPLPNQEPPYTPPPVRSYLSEANIAGDSSISDRYERLMQAGYPNSDVDNICTDMEVQAWYGKGPSGSLSPSSRANLCLAIALVDMAKTQANITERADSRQYFAEPLRFKRPELFFARGLEAMCWAKRLGSQSSDLQWLERKANTLAQANPDLNKHLDLYAGGSVTNMAPDAMSTSVARTMNRYRINPVNDPLTSELPALFSQPQTQNSTSDPTQNTNDSSPVRKVRGLPHWGTPAGMALHPKSTMEEQSEATTPAAPYSENQSP